MDGSLCGVIENAALNYSLAAAGAARPDATAAKILYQENTHGLSVVLLVLYFFPMLACAALAAFALWRAGTVPRWLPPTFAATFYLAIFAPPGGFPGPLLWLPFVAVMLYVPMLAWRRAGTTG